MDHLKSRQLGLFAGFLVGDALGAPFNGIKAGHIQQAVGGRVERYPTDNPVLFPDRPSQNRYPGLHTALGQEFLATLAGFIDDASGQEPVARTASHLRHMSQDGDESHHTVGSLRGPGRALRTALGRWNADWPWEAEAHFTQDFGSEGAGACARGVACAIKEDADPIAYARLTHMRESSLMAAWVVWRAARLLMEEENSKRPDVTGLLRRLKEEARGAEDRLRGSELAGRWQDLGWGKTPVRRFSDSLDPLESMLQLGDDSLAEKTLVGAAGDFGPDRAVTHGQHGFAPTLIPWVLYMALGPRNPTQAIEEVVNRGGETSLAAGLVGALSGARWGVDSIDDDLLGQTHGYRTAEWMLEGISENPIEAWLHDERRWSDLEQGMQSPIRNTYDKMRAANPPKPKGEKKEGGPAGGHVHGFREAPPKKDDYDAILADENLDPREKKRIMAERGRKRIDWKEGRRQGERREGDGF